MSWEAHISSPLVPPHSDNGMDMLLSTSCTCRRVDVPGTEYRVIVLEGVLMPEASGADTGDEVSI